MNTLTLDTHKAVTLLTSKGHSQSEAEGIVEVLQTAQLHENLSTRTDIERLRAELYRAMMIQTGVIIGANTAIMGLLFGIFG